MSDPSGGWAKAIQASAEFGGKVIDAARGLGGFIAGPAAEVVGMVEDQLKVARFERRIRLMDRVDALMKERGMSGPTRQLPLAVGLPLLSYAAVEEDDELQDRWATLLTNAADADSGTEMRRAFVSMLADMTGLDVKCLVAIATAPNAGNGTVLTGKLPECVEIDEQNEADAAMPTKDVAVSLGNLFRLGCITLGMTWGGWMHPATAAITPLGLAFVHACTAQQREATS